MRVIDTLGGVGLSTRDSVRVGRVSYILMGAAVISREGGCQFVAGAVWSCGWVGTAVGGRYLLGI
jgi:hypothetical protein